MIEIDDKIISDDILEEQFVCDLSQCKGACCVKGDAGAPLEKEEINILEEIYPWWNIYINSKRTIYKPKYRNY